MHAKNAAMILTNVGSLDHADVVSTIANTADALLGMLPDEPGNICLLRWRASAGNDSGKLRRDLDELVLEHVEAELQGLAVDDETAVELLLQELQLIAYLVRRLDYASICQLTHKKI